MSSADGRITIEIELEDGTVQRGLVDIGNQSDKAGKKTEGAFSKAGAALKTVGKVAVASAAAVSGLVLAAGGLAAPLVKVAADAQALNSQFSQVFGELEGTAQKAMNEIAKDTGIMADRMTGSFTMLAAFAKTNGFDTAASLELSRRAMIAAADGAAFYDKSLEEVTETLQSYLKGNFENDAALGISSTETTRNIAANKLYSQSFKDLSESQKMLTLLQMVEDGNKLSGALGQAARETDGLENVLGNLNQAWENLKIALGTALLETAINGLKGLTDLLTNFDTAPLVNALTNLVNKSQEIASYVFPVFVQLKDIVMSTIKTIKTYISNNGESILTNITSVFNRISEVVKSVIDAVLPPIQQFLGNMLDYFREAGPELRELFGYIFDGLLFVVQAVLPVVTFLLTAAFEVIEVTIRTVLNVLIGVMEIFKGLFTLNFETLYRGVRRIVLSLAEFIQTIFSNSIFGFALRSAIAFAKKMKEILVGAFKFVLDSVIEFLSPVGEFFTKIWNSISSITSSTWSSIANFLSVTWQSIVSFVEVVFGGIVSFFVGIWSVISGVFESVLSSITFTIEQYWGRISENISSIWGSIVTIFEETWNIIKNVFLGAILIIYDLVTGDFEKLKTDTKQIWDNIVNSFVEIWENIKNIFIQSFQAIISAADQAWTNIKYAISIAFDAIKTFFVDLWNGIVKFFKDTFEKLKKTASESSDNVKKNVTEKWEEIKTNVTKTITNLVDNVKKKFTDIYDSVKEKMEKVKSFFTDTWDEIKEFAEGIDLFEIGGNIIQGLIDGISSLASNITKTVKKLVELIPSTIRKVLDIHSPSRVTEKDGEFAGDGVIVGLKNRIKGVKKAAKDIAIAAIPNTGLNVDNRLSGSSLNVGNIGRGLSTIGTNAPVTSSIDNSKSASYTVNVQNDSTAEIERMFRRMQFAY